MLDSVFTKEYPTLPIHEKEALRYSGIYGDAPETLYSLFLDCARETEKAVCNRICYRVCTASQAIEWLEGCEEVRSRLDGANYAVLFSATVGIEIDRLIARYVQIAPTKAVLLQGLGAERVETLCNAFCKEIEEKSREHGLRVGTRFSPGYGKFPLSAQEKMLFLTDSAQKIGVSATDSLMLSPTKSVTAIVAIGE